MRHDKIDHLDSSFGVASGGPNPKPPTYDAISSVRQPDFSSDTLLV